ncbi:MAG: hypothetical protein WBA31_07525 [Candidatus Dormiibacterota bacterium]
MAPVLFITAVGDGLAIAAHIIWASVLLALLGILLIAEWVYLRHRLASQVSRYLHIRVTWSALPRFRFKQFDRWLASKKALPVP